LPSAFPSGGTGPQIDAPARSQRNVRILVAGTSWLVRDELLPPPDQQQQGQMNGALALALNSVDWLAQDADLIALRAKNIEDPELDVPRSLFTIGQEAITAQARAEQADAQGDQEAATHETQASQRAIDRYKEREKAWNSKKSMYQWGIGLGLPLVVALAGLLWWWARNNRRMTMSQLRAQLGGGARPSSTSSSKPVQRTAKRPVKRAVKR
jgi:hypothetical protein